MNNTLFTNDVVIVSKLEYGSKLPRSPFDIPWLNIAFYFNDNARERIKENWWSYKRLSGISPIKNGDVVVFTMPFGNNTTFVKRCIAIGGDTIEIKNGDVYINNKHFSPSNLVLNNYGFSVSNRKRFYRKLDSLGLDMYINQNQFDNFSAILSIQDKAIIEKLDVVTNMVKRTDTLMSRSSVYPNSKSLQWDLDNYGAYIVPKKGMKIKLNTKNYELYKKVIKTHEEVELIEMDKKYIVNNKELEFYTFKQDYYFMMGDNRNISKDSRVLGFVPQERIIGKVQCILFSNYQNKFQWNRLFKSVD